MGRRGRRSVEISCRSFQLIPKHPSDEGVAPSAAEPRAKPRVARVVRLRIRGLPQRLKLISRLQYYTRVATVENLKVPQ